MPQPQATIPHPNKADVGVYVLKPTRVDLFAVQDEKRNLHRPVAVEGLDGKAMTNPATGELVTRMVPRFTSIEAGIIEQKRVVTGWYGVTDDAGAPIPFSTDKLGLLWEERYDVKHAVCYVCKGEPDAPQHDVAKASTAKVKFHPAMLDQIYGHYINEQLDDPKLFEPKGPTPTVSA